MKKLSAKKSEEDILLEKLLDINPEGELLKEIKDILDELHMMTKVYAERQIVVDSFHGHIQKLGGSKSKKGIGQKTRDKAHHLVKEISWRKAEIHELTRAAERTALGVCLFFLTRSDLLIEFCLLINCLATFTQSHLSIILP
jgi:hypothetical protein